MRLLGALGVILLTALPGAAGLLSPGGVFVQDLTGAPRTQFSNNEQLSLSARVSNATLSTNRIQFTFRINGPAGSQVFIHTGNSVPGTVGNSASSVSGVPVARFYTGPGVYTFYADAALDGRTVTQSAPFTVSSPNIILTYPPNGAQNLVDQPLTFRWVASGAAQYRVTVCDNVSFFNDPSFFQQGTGGTATFLSYPTNPPTSTQRLASGQLYYWKVEGLDNNGNVIATSNPPFSFSVQSAALTRDLAVTSLQSVGISGSQITFDVKVANQGGTTESNVPLRFSLGGLPAAGSPVNLPQMSPGDARDYQFTASLPSDQGQSLAIACLDFFDDNVSNNCKSLQVQAPAAAGAGGTAGSGFAPGASVSQQQLWSQLLQALQQQGTDLSAYAVSEMSQQLTAGDLQALVSQLGSGQAQVTVSGPPAGSALPAAPANVDLSSAPAPVVSPNVDFGLPAPEVAPPTPGQAPAQLFTSAPSKDQLWGAVGDALKGQGIDLSGYIVTGVSSQLSAGDAEALVDQLGKGAAPISLSGPTPPAPAPAVETTPPAETAPPPAAPAPPPNEPARTEAPPTSDTIGREYAGVTGARFGSDGLKMVLRDARAFRKMWKRLSSAEVPDLDFKQVMAVALVAPPKEGATRIEVEDVFETPSGLLVRYSVVGGEPAAGLRAAPRREGVPYMIKVVGASTMPVDFQEVAQEGR